MNNLSIKKLLISILIFTFLFTLGEAQPHQRFQPLKQKKGLFHKGPSKAREIKVKEPRAAEKAKRAQKGKDQKRKRDFGKYVKNNQKRSLEIQTPKVRERMKQNVKDANASYRTKKKNNSSTTRKAGRKYN